MIGQALKIVAAQPIKNADKVAKYANDLMMLPWEAREKHTLTSEDKATLDKRFPKQLPDTSKWQLVT